MNSKNLNADFDAMPSSEVVEEASHCYARNQATKQDRLFDVSWLAEEYEIVNPVAMTESAWERVIEASEEGEEAAKGELDRLRTVLFAFRRAARQVSLNALPFAVRIVKASEPELVQLRASMSNDRNNQAVVLSLPDER